VGPVLIDWIFNGTAPATSVAILAPGVHRVAVQLFALR
jgi:hypothetical protein